jgi:hypothetical protein
MSEQEAAETYTSADGALKLEIFQECDNQDSPRDWDNLGIIAAWHRDYSLSDKGAELKRGEFGSVEECERHLETERGAFCILPVYIYDHSGITINTTGFSCPWDSGQVGFIYTTEAQCKKMGVKYRGKKATEDIKRQLRQEIETFDQYLTGDVYGFVLSKLEKFPAVPACVHCGRDATEASESWKHEDSCWGFYGSDLKESGMLDHIGEENAAALGIDPATGKRKKED